MSVVWMALGLGLAGVPRAVAAAPTPGTSDLPAATVHEVAREPPPGASAPAKPSKPTPAGEEPKKAEEDEENTGEGRVIFPLLMYSPETHVGFGGLLVQFFRLGDAPKESRVSSVAFVALVTTRRQAIFEILPDIYWDDEKNHAGGKLEYQRYPDSYYGIGARSRASDEERYERERLRLRGGLTRRFFGPVYAGLSLDVMQFHGTYSDSRGLFATRDVPGEEGGFTSGLGPTVSFDTRDNAVSSRSGSLFDVTWLLFNEAFGSRYGFWKLFTEARQFFPVGTESALGLRYYGEFQRGDVPYYQLAMLGGSELLRGYFMGRYRSTNLVALEAEYRFPLFWKIGAVVFAGAGEVADVFLERRQSGKPACGCSLVDVPVRFAGGVGFRLSLNTKERLNLRLDIGVTPDTFTPHEPLGVYFTAREAF